MHEESEEDPAALVRAAVEGDGLAMRRLVRRIEPVVRARVARVVHRFRGSAGGRTLDADIDDFVQDTFAALLDRRGRALRAWDPARGLAFESFVAFLAEREVTSSLRSLKRNPWSDTPVEEETLERARRSPDPEREHASRDLLDRILDRLPARTSAKGLYYFQLLFVEQLSLEDAAERSGASRVALYAWRSRLRRTVLDIRREVEGEG